MVEGPKPVSAPGRSRRLRTLPVLETNFLRREPIQQAVVPPGIATQAEARAQFATGPGRTFSTAS